MQRLPLVRRAAGGHHGAGGAGSEPGLGSADPRIEHSHTQRYAEAGAGAAVAETAAQQQYDAAAEQAQAVEEAEYSMQTLEAAAVARPPAPQQAVQASVSGLWLQGVHAPRHDGSWRTPMACI